MKFQKILYNFSLKLERHPLIQAKELYENFDKVKILTSSFLMPPSKEDKKAVFNQQKIGNSQFFDPDLIADKTQDLPHMLPTNKDEFKNLIKDYNLKLDDDIVIYDDFGVIGSSRAYWMLNIYGFQNVYILNGGLNSWNKFIENKEQKVQQKQDEKQSSEEPKLKRKFLTSYDQIQEAQYLCKNGKLFEILDGRSEDRFYSRVKEPREGIRSGHVQGAKPLPFKILLNNDDTFKSNEELQKIFEEREIDFNKHIISYCGSGMTACVIYVALELLGHARKSVYDGSWTEFGGKTQTITDEEIQKQLSQRISAGNSPQKIEVKSGQSYSWCTCGRSSNQPFCDGMHLGTTFRPKKYFADEDGEKWFCNCKKTENQPFCDGSHNK